MPGISKVMYPDEGSSQKNGVASPLRGGGGGCGWPCSNSIYKISLIKIIDFIRQKII